MNILRLKTSDNELVDEKDSELEELKEDLEEIGDLIQEFRFTLWNLNRLTSSPKINNLLHDICSMAAAKIFLVKCAPYKPVKLLGTHYFFLSKENQQDANSIILMLYFLNLQRLYTGIIRFLILGYLLIKI